MGGVELRDPIKERKANGEKVRYILGVKNAMVLLFLGKKKGWGRQERACEHVVGIH